MTTWDDIDEPVLRFVAAQGSSMPPSWVWRLELRPTIASTEVKGVDERQIDEAMLGLQSAGLVDVRQRVETIGYAVWTRPRVTALGSMVPGMWPDLDQVARWRRCRGSLPRSPSVNRSQVVGWRSVAPQAFSVHSG